MKKMIKVLLVMFLTFMAGTGLAQPSVQAQEDTLSILLMGVDTGDLGRDEQGRSDVMMLLTANLKDNSVALTSIPRDTYVDIPGYGMDKINHAYAFGGSDLAVKTVNQLFGIDIDHYLTVNMAGLKDIVDAVDGVEVVPPTSFTIDGYEFIEGQKTPLDGEAALQYARERYTSGGDYARQERQRDIIQAVVTKVQSIPKTDVITLGKAGMALNKNIDTSLGMGEVMDLGSKFYQMSDQIEQYQLTGNGQMIDGVYYDIPDEDSLAEITQNIHQQLGIS
ncbi:LCP family protein [Hutsoniella sourekii]